MSTISASGKFLTDKEFEVLFAIDASEYGDRLQDSVWAFTIADHAPSITGKSISGAVASLAKKGYVWTNGTGSEQEIGITDAGVTAYLNDLYLAGNTAKKAVRA